MSTLDEKRLQYAVNCLSKKTCRQIIQLIEEDKAHTYSEIYKKMGLTNHQSNVCAFHLRKLQDCYLLRHDRETKRYYLTRLGVRLLKLIKSFERAYQEYDINDVAKDGKVECFALVRERFE